MADKKVSDLPSLNGADVDAADLLYIVDSSAGAAGSKKITVGQYQLAPVSGGTANTVVYLNGSKVESSSSALTFDGTNLGIGTSSPGLKLDVAGAIRSSSSIFAGYASGFDQTYIGSNGATGNGCVMATVNYANNAYQPISYDASLYIWRPNGTEGMRLDSSGNLGIGTSSPSAKLHVVGNQYRQNDSTNSFGFTLNTTSATTTLATLFGGSSFAIQTANSGTNQLLLDSSGNLGIGTSSPGVKLEVAGDARLTGANPSLSAVPTSTGFYIDNRGVGKSTIFRVSSASAIDTTAATLDSSGNLGLGVTPSAWSVIKAIEIGGFRNSVFSDNGSVSVGIVSGSYYNAGWKYAVTGSAVGYYEIAGNAHRWFSAPSGTAGNAISFTQAMTLDASGNLLVGQNSSLAADCKFTAKNSTVATPTGAFWNATTTGDSLFLGFYTEASATLRGSIDYNRAGGLTRYNTTSDYRAKDIIGPVQDPGATIDALKVYEGVMKGATQSRPMLIAHEAQEHAPYAVSGVKDEVNEDGTPKFQQIDVSSLVPLLIAEIQSLRARVAALEAK